MIYSTAQNIKYDSIFVWKHAVYVELKWVEKERHETIILFLTVESSIRNEIIANAYIVQKTIISFFEY